MESQVVGKVVAVTGKAFLEHRSVLIQLKPDTDLSKLSKKLLFPGSGIQKFTVQELKGPVQRSVRLVLFVSLVELVGLTQTN